MKFCFKGKRHNVQNVVEFTCSCLLLNYINIASFIQISKFICGIKKVSQSLDWTIISIIYIGFSFLLHQLQGNIDFDWNYVYVKLHLILHLIHISIVHNTSVMLKEKLNNNKEALIF